MDKKLKKTPQIDAEFFLCEVFSVRSFFCNFGSSLRFAFVHCEPRRRFITIRVTGFHYALCVTLTLCSYPFLPS